MLANIQWLNDKLYANCDFWHNNLKLYYSAYAQMILLCAILAPNPHKLCFFVLKSVRPIPSIASSRCSPYSQSLFSTNQPNPYQQPILRFITALQTLTHLIL